MEWLNVSLLFLAVTEVSLWLIRAFDTGLPRCFAPLEASKLLVDFFALLAELAPAFLSIVQRTKQVTDRLTAKSKMFWCELSRSSKRYCSVSPGNCYVTIANQKQPTAEQGVPLFVTRNYSFSINFVFMYTCRIWYRYDIERSQLWCQPAHFLIPWNPVHTATIGHRRPKLMNCQKYYFPFLQT